MSSNRSYPTGSSLPPYSLGDGHIFVTQVSALAPSTTHINSISQANVSSSAAAAGTKRKLQEDEDTEPSRQRRVKVFDVETSEVASGGARQVGARHWSDEEKAKLFAWLMGKDDIWEKFSTQMNTVFRDVSSFVFLRDCLPYIHFGHRLQFFYLTTRKLLQQSKAAIIAILTRSSRYMRSKNT